MKDELREKYFENFGEDQDNFILKEDTVYFVTNQSQNEHYGVCGLIFEKCEELGVQLVYYKKFEPHKPCYREVFVRGPVNKMKIFEAWVEADNDPEMTLNLVKELSYEERN